MVKQYMELKYPNIRRKSRAVKVGNVIIGGGFPVSIQSMTNTDTRNVTATVNQIKALTSAGCEIVRVAVPDESAALKLSEIKSQISIPLVADIHFKHKLALEAIKQGVDKIRINPGNIGEDWKVREVTQAAKGAGIPIRIGVNSGSLPQDLLEKYGHDNPEGFVLAALRQIEILESKDFYDIVISLKSSNVNTAYWAYMMLAEIVDYPFHLGITEAGTLLTGTIKSSVGLGAILINGIGDTIRVSLTADPVEEIKIGKAILKALELKREGIEIISCPTCGRCQIDLIPLAESIEKKTQHYKTPLKVAVMGCVVNGPGEAAAADIGIAGGDGLGILFKKGEIIGKIPGNELESTLLKEIEKMTKGI
jgi:(E)-4-hydroxy-3-methylbut-2-enyl-diphosphate synthase